MQHIIASFMSNPALLVAAVAAVSALFTILGIVGNQYYNRRRSNREEETLEITAAKLKEDSEQEANDRLIKLIQREADKKVDVVKTEFELRSLRMQASYSKQLTQVRKALERKIAELVEDNRMYRCVFAPTCTERKTTLDDERPRAEYTD
jgi:hypothetical protein